jgi:hypothetical protein
VAAIHAATDGVGCVPFGFCSFCLWLLDAVSVISILVALAGGPVVVPVKSVDVIGFTTAFDVARLRFCKTAKVATVECVALAGARSGSADW